MNKQNDEFTIRNLIKVFLPKLWIIALVAVVLASAVGVISAIQEDTYTSEGKYMMNKLNMEDPDNMIGLNTSEVEAMGIMINSIQEMIDTDNFAKKVIATLSESGRWTSPLSTNELREMMTIVRVGNETTCFYLEITSNDKELSFAVAEVAGELLVAEYERINKYAVSIARIDDAALAKQPNSKNIVRNAIIAFLVGAVLSSLVIFIIFKFDVVIRSKDMLEEYIDLPVLGVIPRLEQAE